MMKPHDGEHVCQARIVHCSSFFLPQHWWFVIDRCWDGSSFGPLPVFAPT